MRESLISSVEEKGCQERCVLSKKKGEEYFDVRGGKLYLNEARNRERNGRAALRSRASQKKERRREG